MREYKPSTTAQHAAMRRAAHQIMDDPKVLDDPVALRIIGRGNASALEADPGKFESSPVSSYLRAFIAARSRCAEDELAEGVRRGLCQYVVLGAGLDTFAYRNPHPADALRVFEVDHPATQAWKRTLLEEAGIAVPAALTFAPVDFESQTLQEGLAKAGCDPGKCTSFSWLGVTEYLSPEAVMATLNFVASMPTGSGIVFDYMLSPSLLNPRQRYTFDAIAQRVASDGEPWHAFFDPRELAEDLRSMGFGHIEDRGPEETNARYFAGRADGLRVGSLSHIMTARV